MLSVNDLTIRAGDFTVDSVSFEVRNGEYYFLLGPSGSGKSLILEAIAGIQKIRQGTIRVQDKEITQAPVNRRQVGMVFQNLALFMHLSVFKNIAYPLFRLGWERDRIQSEVEQMAEKLSIGSLLQRYPGSLSGGEHQRVALARTLIMKPAVLLLDEPLSSLDILLKEEMMELLRDVHQQGQTLLHVTHDYHVVSQLADRMSILETGTIIQSGTLQEIRKEPRCLLAERL